MSENRSLDDYQRIEREVGEWAEENFGAAQPHWYPLIGAAEEIGEIAACYDMEQEGYMSLTLRMLDAVGELAHSNLKRAQGIREDEPGVGRQATLDALNHIRAIATLMETFDPDGVGEASVTPEEYEEVADGLGDAHIYLSDYSYRNPLRSNLSDCLAFAWYGEVAHREWDADVTVGGSHD